MSTPESDSVTRSLLPSGLRVVSEWVPGVQSASVGVWIGVGSRDETPDQAGAAHYLEHLLFKGTAKRTAAQIAEEIDAVGGELNAFTAKEHTCFYAHVLDSDLPLAVDLLSDVVTAATMEAEHVEVERAVVLEEIAMRADDPEDLLGEVFDTALFGDHPLGLPVIGSVESIEAMTRNRLHEFWQRHYTPSRMVVAAAGNVSHDRVVELVEQMFPSSGSAQPARPRGGLELPVTHSDLLLHGEDTEQVHLMLGLRGLDRHDPRRVPLEVLNTALGGGMSSRLFQQVREQRGLAYSVYSATTSYQDAGQLAIYAGCQPDRLGEVVTVIRQVLADVVADGLTDAEVARAKGAMRGGLVLGMEDTASRMHRIGRHELDLGRQRSLRRSLELIEAVRPDEVASVAEELLTRPLTAAVVGPYDSPDDLPASLTS
ncbi:M16 family metallopeptidase [Pseudonocardia spinosispora]|uniref:M16 family metallopeptidase n=1 Tax=Pseudonocardia spinosispora TaxID=103441 RepID=UPI000491E27E|nr:pitrilysin family protein [Pseudonocardia spinosispora]